MVIFNFKISGREDLISDEDDPMPEGSEVRIWCLSKYCPLNKQVHLFSHSLYHYPLYVGVNQPVGSMDLQNYFAQFITSDTWAYPQEEHDHKSKLRAFVYPPDFIPSLFVYTY